ncbi:MAG: polymer-forming cytoskeletal protein [Candidatus Falkowbacteria bacterium]|nr:polymer-forming cytoskeletal protein [Candidatus Falkowbacteria bacterium]
MFNKENRPEKFKDAETIIGSSIKVKGNFHGQGNIIIEGSLEGSLKTEANLFIGDKAKIVANIEAQEAIINGELKGDVKIKKYLAIGKTAKIFGNLQYGEISIEKGGLVNGQLLLMPENKKSESKDNKEELEK